VRRIALFAAIALSAGCAHIRHSKGPSVGDEWNSTLSVARQAADSGKYDSADRVLADFISAHRGSHEATEAIFWRGLYKVDPNNKSGSLLGGISALDAYLASDSAVWHRSVAVVLRRTALLAQSLKGGAAVPPVVLPPPGDKDAMKSRDEEIASLRDQLAKVNAELERIKKRLANPKA